MRAVVQRVKGADVSVEGEKKGKIGGGLMVLLAVHENDQEEVIVKMADKLINLRIFGDENGKMNLSVKEIGGEILIVSQFTLYGDVSKGTRPSFTGSAKKEKAESYYDKLVGQLKLSGLKVETWVFGAMMMVCLVNDGPVTIILDL